MTVLANCIPLSSATSSFDLGPGIEVLMLGPEGSPRIRVERDLTFLWCLREKLLDFAMNTPSLLNAMVDSESKQVATLGREPKIYTRLLRAC